MHQKAALSKFSIRPRSRDPNKSTERWDLCSHKIISVTDIIFWIALFDQIPKISSLPWLFVSFKPPNEFKNFHLLDFESYLSICFLANPRSVPSAALQLGGSSVLRKTLQNDWLELIKNWYTFPYRTNKGLTLEPWIEVFVQLWYLEPFSLTVQ